MGLEQIIIPTYKELIPSNFTSDFSLPVPQKNNCWPIIIGPWSSTAVEPIIKPFVPALAMTPRMRRIHTALLAHQKTRIETYRLLQSSKILSTADRGSVIARLAMIARSRISDYMSSEDGPFNIAAIESPQGLAVRLAIEYRGRGFKLELCSKLRALRHLRMIVVELEIRQRQRREFQDRIEKLTAIRKELYP